MTQPGDIGQRHDHRAVRSNERPFAKATFDTGERGAQKEGSVGGVNADIVTFGDESLDGID